MQSGSYFELHDDTAWGEQQVWGDLVPENFDAQNGNAYATKGWSQLTYLAGEILKKGQSADFRHSTNELWVVSDRFAQLLTSEAGHDVRCVPIKLNGKLSGFQALFILHEVECLDWERSEVERYERDDFWEEDIAKNPDLLKQVGTIKYIRGLTLITKSIPPEVDIFRPKMPFTRSVVSARLQKAIIAFKPVGVLFEPAPVS